LTSVLGITLLAECLLDRGKIRLPRYSIALHASAIFWKLATILINLNSGKRR